MNDAPLMQVSQPGQHALNNLAGCCDRGRFTAMLLEPSRQRAVINIFADDDHLSIVDVSVYQRQHVWMAARL